jgi:hypothetical protein
MEPKKLTKLLSDAGITFTQWQEWEQVQRELATLRVARDKAEAKYCLFLYAVEQKSPEWRAGLDSKEPQTFDHWIRKNALHDDPARYRAMLVAIDEKGLNWVQRVGPLAVATVVKNLPAELRAEGLSRLSAKRDDVGQPVAPKTAPSIVASIKAAHPEVCPPQPKQPQVARLGHKLQLERSKTKTAEEENRDLKAKVVSLEKERDQLLAENAELRERLGAAKTALDARGIRNAGKEQVIAQPAE